MPCRFIDDLILNEQQQQKYSNEEAGIMMLMSLMDHNQQKIRQQQQQQQLEKQKRRNSYDISGLTSHVNNIYPLISTKSTAATANAPLTSSRSSSAILHSNKNLMAINNNLAPAVSLVEPRHKRSLSKIKSPAMEKMNSFEVIEEEDDNNEQNEENDNEDPSDSASKSDDNDNNVDEESDEEEESIVSNSNKKKIIENNNNNRIEEEKQKSCDNNSTNSSTNVSLKLPTNDSINVNNSGIFNKQPRIIKIPWSPQPQAPKVHLPAVDKILSPPPSSFTQQKRNSIISWTRKRAQRFMSTFGQSLDQSIQTVQSFLSPPPDSSRFQNPVKIFTSSNTTVPNTAANVTTVNANVSALNTKSDTYFNHINLYHTNQASSYYRQNYHYQQQQLQQQQQQQKQLGFIPKGDPFWYHKSYCKQQQQVQQTQQSNALPQIKHNGNGNVNNNKNNNNFSSSSSLNHYQHRPQQQQQPILHQPTIKTLSKNLDHFYYVYENGYIKKVLVICINFHLPICANIFAYLIYPLPCSF